MRVSIINRFNPKYVAILVLAIFGGQLLEGTNFLFAVLTAVYIVLWASAFNVAGGIERPTGAFVFSNGLLSVVVGFGAKVLLGEPGERNLRSPILLMLAYTGSMAMILVVTLVVRALRPQRALLTGFTSLVQMRQASIVCLFIGLAIAGAASRRGVEEGSLLSALAQINAFPIVAIFLATTYEIRRSEGRRSINWVGASGMGIFIASSLFSFGKSGILLAFTAWGFAAALNGYSFKLRQMVILAIGTAFFLYYFVPYSQYVRLYTSKTGSLTENIPVALEYLSDLNRTRALYEAGLEQVDINEDPHLYDQREGFLDRLIQVPVDDWLIDYTAQGHVFGLTPLWFSYLSVIPHFIWPGKPFYNFGNEYAHEIGIVSDEDVTTGIAFSPTAEVFHLATWLGVFIVMPLQLFLLFIVYESVTGGTKDSVFAMVPILNFFQGGAAGGITGVGHAITVELLAILLIAWTTKVAMPFVLNTLKSRTSSPVAAVAVGGSNV